MTLFVTSPAGITLALERERAREVARRRPQLGARAVADGVLDHHRLVLAGLGGWAA
eukprot:COSAG02_NODE_39889_length_411_cov_1.163462_1_plen_55_part_01